MGAQTRCFIFKKDFITCMNCQLNYSAINPRQKTFCQEFSFFIEADDLKKNNERALACAYWFPGKLVRSKGKVDAPEHERWYEKDSMA